jgi:malonate transporter
MSLLADSLVPIFALIVFGLALRKAAIADDAGWQAMERISYYVFFPALLVQTLYRADFSLFSAGGVAAGFFAGILALMAAMYLLRRPLQAAFSIDGPAFSSLFQATTRWNAFVILAIVEKLHGPHEMAIVAIGIGALIVPINIVNVAVLAVHGNRDGARPSPWRQIARNPLILAVLAGIALNLSGLRLPVAAETVMEMLARISLPLGLLLVGAGLRFATGWRNLATVGTGTAVKLLIMPLFLAGAAWLFGVRGGDLAIIALCGAGPSAMNGYVVARQMGGDAPLFAQIVTAQTAASFLTIPLVLAVAAYAAG